MTADAFRHALGAFATGVVLVTARVDDRPEGLIVSSFASVSLDPPLVAFCPSAASLTWKRMRTAARIGINVLSHDHGRYARAAAVPGADRFAGIAHTDGPGGVPKLDDAVAFLACTIDAEHRAGDHWIVVARVEDAAADRDAAPLVNYASDFRALAS
jgi:3-hydroxy-9,10-secoandrosta-1,3,5(10)-triene-9,17-dione monooxygenase reductase component